MMRITATGALDISPREYLIHRIIRIRAVNNLFNSRPQESNVQDFYLALSLCGQVFIRWHSADDKAPWSQHVDHAGPIDMMIMSSRRALQEAEMPNVQKYIATFLNADDLKDGPRVITISDVTEGTIKDGDTKEAKGKLFLDSEDLEGKRIALNKTQIESLMTICKSDETDDWKGIKVEVYRDPSVTYRGKKVGGIAFRAVK